MTMSGDASIHRHVPGLLIVMDSFLNRVREKEWVDHGMVTIL